ncbi:glycosyltransferase involved in cell wall biosynthesis [Paraburkholderia bannensis]|uniref:Glycosyltransferase involved in cell wall biosynthesis n=1 Tax=Paraburkholderia bannensis TaxID=765414 RepID=A0A7W9TUQ6_9BURK|nr:MULTISPECIES: glycosyltransferase family 2 protein [Paraburkholderia]MBB3255243.1 glycosyltransferase involved in cell wall biosynthesis [Paraburkholderia sp. WP4_3_2]MBB6100745.1 glycosyltransferase involved in cell wall biosynthesis [Paraburkholderia bannensis]
MNISVVILTKNEEVDIEGCLASVGWSNDIWVLDSESEDKTVEIATRNGASVRVRRFDGFASQRNFGLRELPYRHEWLLILDADERVTVELRQALMRFVETASPAVAAGRIQRRDFFMNRWLRHAQISP